MMERGHGYNVPKRLDVDRFEAKGENIIESFKTEHGDKCEVVQRTKKNGKLGYYLFVNGKRATIQVGKKMAYEFLDDCKKDSRMFTKYTENR